VRRRRGRLGSRLGGRLRQPRAHPPLRQGRHALALVEAAAKATAQVEAANAAVAESGEGEAAELPPPPELTEAESDCIVELSLNGQQWTTDCKHFTFVLDPTVASIDPPSCGLEGEAPLKITGAAITDTGALKARFTKFAAPVEEGAEVTLPEPGAEFLVVDATFAEGCADVLAPVFEGTEEPFDCAVQLSADGQVFGPTFAVFKYEAGAAKGKKK